MHSKAEIEKTETNFPGSKSAGNADADNYHMSHDDMPGPAEPRKYPAYSTILTLVVLGIVSLLTIAGVVQLGVIESTDTSSVSIVEPS